MMPPSESFPSRMSLARADVLIDVIHSFDDYPITLGEDAKHFALFPCVISSDDAHEIVLTHVFHS